MALEKITEIKSRDVIENGSVQVCTVIRIVEDGVVLSQTLHRHVVAPGDDYSQEDAKVQRICALEHTPEVIAAYQATMQAVVKPI